VRPRREKIFLLSRQQFYLKSSNQKEYEESVNLGDCINQGGKSRKKVGRGDFISKGGLRD